MKKVSKQLQPIPQKTFPCSSRPCYESYLPGNPSFPLSSESILSKYVVDSKYGRRGTRHDFGECATTHVSYSTDLFTYWLRLIHFFMVVILAWRGQNSSRAVIKTPEDITSKTMLQAVFLGQRLICISNSKGTDSKLLLLEISICRNLWRKQILKANTKKGFD